MYILDVYLRVGYQLQQTFKSYNLFSTVLGLRFVSKTTSTHIDREFQSNQNLSPATGVVHRT